MKKFKLISCLVIFPAVLLVACKSTIGATPTSTTHFAFNDTKTEYNGIDIIQKNFILQFHLAKCIYTVKNLQILATMLFLIV